MLHHTELLRIRRLISPNNYSSEMDLTQLGRNRCKRNRDSL